MELSGWWELVQQVLTEEFYREEEKLSRTYAKCAEPNPASALALWCWRRVCGLALPSARCSCWQLTALLSSTAMQVVISGVHGDPDGKRARALRSCADASAGCCSAAGGVQNRCSESLFVH